MFSQITKNKKREGNIVELFFLTQNDLMFNIKHLVMHKVQVHNTAISYLVYGSSVCMGR